MPEGPLHGLRVLEAGQGLAPAMVGMVLADFGASVIKIEAPGGDPARAMAAFAMLNRGKASVVADLATAAGRERAGELVAGADVVVVAMGPSDACAAGLDAPAIRGRNPNALVCAVTPFGPAGAYAEYPGSEHVVSLKAGRGYFYVGQALRDGPVFPALPVATFAGAQAALQGIFAGLHARARGLRADHVETSLLQAYAAFDFFGWRDYQQPGKDFFRDSKMADGRRQRSAALSYIVAPTADGHWLQFIQAAGHLFYRFMAAIGLDQLFLEERFMNLPNVDPVTAMEAWRIIVARIRERTFAEWMDELRDNDDVTVELFRSPAWATDHPQVVHNGDFIRVQDPVYGEMLQLAPLFDAAGTPACVRPGAPPLGGAGVAWPGRERAAAVPVRGDTAERGPLHGVRVVELARFYAAPFGATMLADLGADVVKVEALEGEQPFGAGISKTSQGKRSIALNLKDPRGRAVLEDLVRSADIFVHNFRAGVPERLGIAYGDLRALNPRLIYLNAAGFGTSGPLASHPAFDPLPGIVTGNAWRQGGGLLPPDTLTTRALDFEAVLDTARRTGLTNWGFGDPVSALVVATALTAGLCFRDRTGEGQELTVNMLRSNLYLGAEEMAFTGGRPASVAYADGDYLGTGPLYRLYRAAGGTWIFLACTGEEHWARLRTMVADPCLEASRFATAGARERNAAELADLLGGFFATRDACAWEADLAAAGVPVVRADGPQTGEFWVTDPHVLANGFAATVTDSTGTYVRHGPVVRVDGWPAPEVLRGSSLLGEHSREVLESLGYGAEQIGALFDAGVVRGRTEAAARPGEVR